MNFQKVIAEVFKEDRNSSSNRFAFCSLLGVLFVLVLLLPACTLAAESGSARASGAISSYEECVRGGYPILRSMPARCVTPDGKQYVDSHMPKVPHLQNEVDLCKDLCGDGTCQEIVCFAEGCPCAENHATCPQDCP